MAAGRQVLSEARHAYAAFCESPRKGAFFVPRYARGTMQLDDQVAGLNMNQNLPGNADSRDWGIKKKGLPTAR